MREQSAKRNLVAVKQRKSLVAEQFRTIRTNILMSKSMSELKTIAVTSAIQSEGKSTTVANLACMFAENGQKVLLIDADMRRPTVHFTFEVNNLSGLSNSLIAKEEEKPFIKKTKIPNLFVLTSGPMPPNPASLLSSPYFEKLIKELSEQYNIILFDTPPVLAVTDTQLVLNVVSASMLVINMEQSDKKIVQKANDIVQAAKASYLGVVLNNMTPKQSEIDYRKYATDYYFD